MLCRSPGHSRGHRKGRERQRQNNIQMSLEEGIGTDTVCMGTGQFKIVPRAIHSRIFKRVSSLTSFRERVGTGNS